MGVGWGDAANGAPPWRLSVPAVLTRRRPLRRWLFSNRLTGEIPDSLASLTQLGSLGLSHNLFSQPLPSFFQVRRLRAPPPRDASS